MIWTRRPVLPLDVLASELFGHPVFGREIPLKGVTPTLRQACDARAAELAQRPETEMLILLSGGADSTLAAAALSRPLHAAGKRVVYATTPSGRKDLDPITMDWLLALGAEERPFNGAALDAYKDGFIITGILGDELYGGSVVCCGGSLRDTIWSMTVDEAIGWMRNLTPSAELTQRYMPLFEDMPYPLTAPNIFHWIAFKYTWGREQLVLAVSADVGMYGERHTHFFDAPELQQWMMQDMTLRCGQSALTMKDQGIALIREYVGAPVRVPQKNNILDEVITGTGNLYDVLRIDEDGTIHRRMNHVG